ncbi:flagella basal body P-ring formation protein FlgA precursor [mine drainage metagenome]|uniref:Flagella basal body P-ring formation protein FlgA n=1 Tax=mine drainage metagenome TaxID=410659 RepID=A0A1J5RZC4_9ZZZZ
MNCIAKMVYLNAGRITLMLFSVLSTAISFAATVEPMVSVATQPTKQNLTVLRAKVTDFLETQTIGYPGKVSVRAGAIDPNLRLTSCANPQVFLPAGSRAWGKTSVGVRCDGPSAWTIYVQASVNVAAKYLVAATPLSQGSIVTSQDVLFENGDLTQLPAGVFTDVDQAIGRIVNISMTAGTVLRQDMLKMPPAVQRGQTVMVTSVGQGFTVAAEGQAMANASEGQVVQVRVSSGQLISGIARAGGQVDVGF